MRFFYVQTPVYSSSVGKYYIKARITIPKLSFVQFYFSWGVGHLHKKVGIPRGLLYYKFKPFWEIFFTELGAEIIVSDPTNKRILDDGVKVCVDEACLPIKLFCGHVLNIADRVDYILVPRFTSISKGEYICPEFGGLPDMIRHTLKGLPVLIDTEVNMRKSKRGGIKAAIDTAAIIGAGRRAACAAYKHALSSLKCEEWGDVSSEVRTDEKWGDVSSECGGWRDVPCIGPGKSQESRETSPMRETSPLKSPLKVAVIGHPYNIYDKYISMDLLNKLEKYGAEVMTIEKVRAEDINRQASRLAKPMFWYYGRNAYGAAAHLAGTGKVEGIICVTSFGCGIDSFINDLTERRIRRQSDIPLITMTIDEHSGEAGFNTRLEAFIDMLYWRRLHENNISTPWEHLYHCQIDIR